MNDIGATFRKLHVPGDPVIMVNVWDKGSARMMQAMGAKAPSSAGQQVPGPLPQKSGWQASVLRIRSFRQMMPMASIWRWSGSGPQ